MAQTKVTKPGITDDAVTTAKILDDNVTTAKILDLNVTVDKLANTLDLSSKTVTLPSSALSYPTFTSVTPSIATNDLTSLVIVGTNFGSSGIPAVEFQSTTGFITAASSVVRDSATQLTVGATIPTDGTYYIRIELNTGLAVRSSTAVLTISDAPAWTTGSGSLGTIIGDFSGTVATVAATGDGVEYTETTDVLTNAALANCTLNSSTGVITTTDFGGSSTEGTTYTFTIRATDDQAQTSDREFTLTSAFAYTTNFLVIAGGASGGKTSGGGGGGAGGYKASWNSEASGGGGSSLTALELTTGTAYTITIGAGGVAASSTNDRGFSGENSVISGSDITDITSTGGGAGGGGPGNGAYVGGSGGGGSDGTGVTVGAAGTANQGYAGGTASGTNEGYNGAGGGGASAVGVNGAGQSGGTAGAGGAGVASTITGSSVTRGGGGGGASYNGTVGAGGSGGGGAGSHYNVSATAGTANTGGGGGATQAAVGVGGSGVVILRMADGKYSATTTGSPTVATAVDGTDTVLTFTASGSYTA